MLRQRAIWSGVWSLQNRNNTVVSEQELERLQTAVTGAESQHAAAIASLDGAKLRQSTLLPAQLETARAVLREAEAEISKSTVFAEVDGTVTQFLLKPGDIVNPILRPAGILVPEVTGQGRFIAAFGQISASVLKPGMLVEITCASKPLTIVPMVVDDVQDAIAAGQFRPGGCAAGSAGSSATWYSYSVPSTYFPKHLESIPPGSACVGVAYTSRAKEIDAGEITGLSAFIGKDCGWHGYSKCNCLAGTGHSAPCEDIGIQLSPERLRGRVSLWVATPSIFARFCRFSFGT